MIVRCVSHQPNAEQVFRLGKGFADGSFDKLTVGDEYVVLGLQFEQQSLIWGTGPWIKVVVEGGLLSAPLCLFEIADGTVSRYWRTQLWEDGSVTLWPASFYETYYFNDLESGKQATLDDFRRVHETLEGEARGSS